jgi:uncharacterized membrane protein
MKIWQVLIICFGLMLAGANQSLWLDEAISANVVKNFGYKEIVSNFSVNDFHPPFYYFVLKTWTSVFGYSEISLRMPSIIFVLVIVFVVFKLGGINAAMLTGFNPLLIYYSQETRMYALVTMLLTLTVYFFTKKKYVWVNVFAFLAFLTFYGSIFLLASLGLYLLINKRYKELVISNIGLIIAIMLISPLLKLQLQNSTEMLNTVKNWSLVLGKANIKNLLLIPMKFTSGRISFYPKVLYYLISGAFSIFVFVKLFKKNFYSFVFWVSLLVGVVFSMFTPMLQYFRFLYLIPIMALIINKNKNIMIGFLGFSLFYLINQNMWREDWKSLSHDLGNNIYMISSFGDPIKYYKNQIMISDIRSPVIGKEVLVVPYGEAIHGVDHTSLLEKQGYKLVKIKNFRELSLETWQRN